jgi:hypothetical protein
VGNAPFVKVQGPSAAEICARFNPDKDSRALLRDGMAPREFVDALLSRRQFVNGIDFMAHALPQREAIWWGSLCLQHADGANLQGPEKSALMAAVIWVLWPTEANRSAAEGWGGSVGPACAPGALAMAAGGSGGMTPAKAVANAVKIAVTKTEPARFADTQRLFVELGIGVAEGRFSWPPS